MKKVFLPVLLLLALAACNNSSEKKSDSKDTATTEVKDPPVMERTLIGNWKAVAAEPVGTTLMTENEKKEIVDSMTVEFKSDGTFSSTMKGETVGGTYIFSEQDGKLMTTQTSGKEKSLYIKWDGNNMVLNDEQMRVTLKRL